MPLQIQPSKGLRPKRRAGVPRRTWLPSPTRLPELVADPALTRRLLTQRPKANALANGAKLIGLFLGRDEHDMLDDSLAMADAWFDAIYVLEGTKPGPERDACLDHYRNHPVVAEVCFDDALPEAARNRDGSRQLLLEAARRDHGVDNWIAILHGDEILQQDPRLLLATLHPSVAPSVRVRVAHHFLHTEAEAHWDRLAPLPLRQRVDTLMWPGVPETRFFFDRGDRNYRLDQHSQVVPRSLRVGPLIDGFVVHQFNYRSPTQAQARAADRTERGWQAQHYRHLRPGVGSPFVSTLDLVDDDGPNYEHLDTEPPIVTRSSATVPWINPAGLSEASNGRVSEYVTETADRVANPDVRRWITGPDGLVATLHQHPNDQVLPYRSLARLRGQHSQLADPRPGFDASFRYLWRGLRARHINNDQRWRYAAEFVAGLVDGPAGAAPPSQPTGSAAAPS